MVLVDSNVLSELTQPAPNEKVSLIAATATAIARGFKVATRNTTDFKNARVLVENPFSA